MHPYSAADLTRYVTKHDQELYGDRYGRGGLAPEMKQLRSAVFGFVVEFRNDKAALSLWMKKRKRFVYAAFAAIFIWMGAVSYGMLMIGKNITELSREIRSLRVE